MNSGVYSLTFKSNEIYIGKSIDIPKRWQEHYESFIKGKASKLLQAEFNKYGQPIGKVLVTCHPDHIDLVEACCIARLRPTLNTVDMQDPLNTIGSLDDIMHYLEESTLTHIDRMNRQAICIDTMNRQLKDMTRQIEFLERERSLEEIQVDSHNKLQLLEHKYNELKEECEYLKISSTSTWWKKLFR